MNFKAIIAASACALSLMACGGPGEGKSLSDIKNATETDSLFYYFGQLRANDYWQQSVRDSTFNSMDARQQYLKGMQEGLKMVKSGNEAYNLGLFNGLTIALNCQEFEKEFKLKPNNDVILESVAYGLRSDSAVNASEAQAAFYEIMGRLNDKKAEQDKQAAASALKEKAASLKMTAVNDNLFIKVINPGSGADVKRGDKVSLKIDFKKGDGSDLGMPMPDELEVGPNLPEELCNALLKMKQGEKAEFLTSALALFGQRCSQMGLEPSELLMISIDLTGITAGESPANDSTASTPAKPVKLAK